MKPTLLIALAAAAAPMLPIAAQPSPFSGMSSERLTVRDGLSSNIVSCIVQDADGYVWIATYNGLNVYDGYGVASYPMPQGSGAGPAPIVDMTEDRLLNTLSLVASNGRTACFSLTTRRYVAHAGKSDEMRRKGPIIAHFNGVTYRNNGDGSLTRTAPGASPKTMRLLPRAILAYTGQDHFHAVALPDGREAISTYGAGLFVYDPDSGSLAQLTAENSGGVIGSNYITALMADRSGCLWLAEDFSGLNILRFPTVGNSRIVAAPEADIPDKNYVRHVAVEPDGRLLLADNYGTCHLADPQGRRSTKAAWRGGRIYCTLTDSRGRRWVGTRGGGLYIGGRHLTTGNSALPSMDIYDILEDSGGRVWVATLGGGVIRADVGADGGVAFAPFFAGQGATAKAHDIELDGQGRLWIATEGGLCVAEPSDPARRKVYDTGNSPLPSDYLVCLEEGAGGYVWAGTVGGGLLRLRLGGDRLECMAISTGQGLASADVNSIAVDASGRVWAGTGHGLSCYSPDDNSVGNHFFGAGIHGDTYSEKACATLPDGSIVFGTHRGAVRVWPGGGAPRAAGHRTFVTSVEVNGHRRDPGREASLGGDTLAVPYDMNTLAFSFSNFCYADLRSVQYQYYLEGLEDGWGHPTGRNTATYTKLPPGSYRLHVRSNDGRGNWGGEATMAIAVMQPWWNSAAAWGAYAMAAAVLAAAAAFGLRRIWVLRRRLEVERGVTEMKLSFFTAASHELTVPLTLIRAAADQIVEAGKGTLPATAVRTVAGNAARLCGMVERLVQFRKLSKLSLVPRLRPADFVATVRGVCDNFRGLASSRGVRIVLTPFAKSHTGLFDPDMIETVVANLVDNAVKFSPPGGVVDVGIRLADGRLSVAVADGGPGVADGTLPQLFIPYAGIKTAGGGLGMGLYVSRQAALAMGGTLGYAKAAAGGALFTLTVPDRAAGGVATGGSLPQPAVAAGCERELLPVPMNPGVTVVVVEGDAETLGYMGYRLSEYFTVVEAGFAEAVSVAVGETDASLVVIGSLAQADAYALAARLRRERGQRTRTIIVDSDGSDSNRIKAVEAGADDFFVRPFGMGVLVASCVRSVEVAAKWRRASERAGGAGRPERNVKEVVTEHKDKRFVDTFNRLLEANAADPDFSTDAFAAMMKLGRAQFYKRTVELTGETPAAHLRRARMEHVARRLAETDLTVDEIRIEAGFANQTHFYNTFRKYFGVSPAQYRGGERAEPNSNPKRG